MKNQYPGFIKFCLKCGAPIPRRALPIQVYRRRLYCSKDCSKWAWNACFSVKKDVAISSISK